MARILLFDSGMGGLTVAGAVARQMPSAHLVYAADTAGFPYGAWDEQALVRRIIKVMEHAVDSVRPDVVVIACNTASTIAMVPLRAKFKIPFVGTVPAIKPAAAQTKTGVIGVLATPGTARREYTKALITDFAANAHVILHGAPRLAEMAERKLTTGVLDLEQLREEVAPVFQEVNGKRTDMVVLGCTHYPLLTDDIAAVAPWPVTYLDPSTAIARRVGDVLDETACEVAGPEVPPHGTAIITSQQPAESLIKAAYAKMGFPHQLVLDLPV